MNTPAFLQGNVYEEVFFSESMPPPETRTIRRIVVSVNRQNANLSDVKSRMASQAKECGANSIVNFRYGQRSHKWWQLVFTFKWDSEGWYGEGDAVYLV